MKNHHAFLIGISLFICGCSERHEIENPEETPIDIEIMIGNLSSDTESISLTLSAEGSSRDDLDRWGVTYGTEEDRTKGTDKTAEGKPADSSAEVTVTGLEDNTVYFIWGWAEGNNGERIWTEGCSEIITKQKLVIKDPIKLIGKVIGTVYSVDYDHGNVSSTTVNTIHNVFDGKFDTYFASYDRSGTWVGMDLGEKHVITKIGYSPRISQEGRVQLAVIEGANKPDFSDALPIYMIKEAASSGTMHHKEVDCSMGFRYVRYVSPNNVRCNLAELEFYGYPAEGDESRLYQVTDLPTVVINTPDAQEITSKEYELSSNVYIISENGTNLLKTSETGVRGRGNASWDFPKKPYRLKFSSRQSPLGAPASAKKWTLINNYGDKTLMRNILAFEVSRRVGQSYTPFCHPVDLIVNGEYRGCYQLCDQVEAADGRVEAKDGYLIEIDAYAYSEDVWFSSGKGTPVTIKHPDEDDITSQQKAFITNYFNKMETAVFSSDFTDDTNGYRKYLDLDSFLRNFIVGEFCGNTDTYWSVYMYKDNADGKLFTGPAWDYDLAFENDARTYPINSLTDFIYCSRGSVASEAVRSMVTRIVKNDPEAKKRLIEIWEAACTEGKLTELNSLVDETKELLLESQELNFKRWDILNQTVHQNFQALGSYEAEVQVVKQYINGRLDKFDQLINNL
ncbi:MAG: CotH kinase family protein [Bacteroidales bacterium]|nr:CotH kinase family protein [Bacteroidales bacterium]